MKNPVVLVLFLALAIIIGYSIYLGYGPAGTPSTPQHVAPPPTCKEGGWQYCSIDSCSGISTCVGGVWSACKWDTVCTPGARAPCINNGCVYAVKDCNQCGTGYSQCFVPSNMSGVVINST